MSSKSAPSAAAAPVAAVASTLPSYTPIQQRIVGCLRVFLGEQAAPLYDAHGRSLQRLAAFARDSGLPGCQELSTGLALAQALLAEAMSSAPVFDSPAAVTDFLKLHFAGQAYESFVVVFLDAPNAFSSWRTAMKRNMLLAWTGFGLAALGLPALTTMPLSVVYNPRESVPHGWYRIAHLAPAEFLQVGSSVLATIPAEVAALAAQRWPASWGACPQTHRGGGAAVGVCSRARGTHRRNRRGDGLTLDGKRRLLPVLATVPRFRRRRTVPARRVPSGIVRQPLFRSDREIRCAGRGAAVVDMKHVINLPSRDHVDVPQRLIELKFKRRRQRLHARAELALAVRGRGATLRAGRVAEPQLRMRSGCTSMC